MNVAFDIDVKEIRKRLQLTQKDFGNQFDPPVSNRTVIRWEQGTSPQNVNHVLKLVALYLESYGIELKTEVDANKKEIKRISRILFNIQNQLLKQGLLASSLTAEP